MIDSSAQSAGKHTTPTAGLAKFLTIEATTTLDIASGTGAGSFTMTGAIEGAGAASLQFWLNGSAIDGRQTLMLDDGATATLRFKGETVFTSMTEATLSGGFVLSDGGSDSGGLHGAGHFSARLFYDPQQAALVLNATYTGQAHPGDRLSGTGDNL